MNAPDIYKQFAQGLEPNPLNDLANSMCLHGRHIKPQIMADVDGAWPTTSSAAATKP